MTPQEKDLIQGVFTRLAQSANTPKDPEAAAFIRDQAAHLPDAMYGLVQAVIVQDMGLGQAQRTINDLQRQLEEARSAQAAPASGGSFLGGASPWGGGSVPRSGNPAQPAAPAYQAQPQGFAQPQPATTPWGGQPASGAGSFLRSAATMAAGVAGGTLIAEGLSSLFSGHRGGFGGGGFASGSPWGGGSSETVENVTVNNYYGDQGDAGTDTQDSSYQDASYDDSGFDSSFDDTSDV